MNKIIFLDFDGVLNCIGTKDRIIHPVYKEKFRGIDNFRVDLVSELATKAVADIVISSSWRHFFSLEELTKLLQDRGLDSSVNIVGQTSKVSSAVGWGFSPIYGVRGDEIRAWRLENGNPDTYLILDDIDCHDPRHQVLTSDSSGFYDSLMPKAKKILGI